MRREFIYAGVLLLGVIAWFTLRARDKKVDKQITSTVLAPADQAKVILDPQHHRIETITRTGPVKNTYLPPHVTSVTVEKNGSVTVKTREWGTEVAPFMGFGYGDRTRLVAGVGLLYWHGWEANVIVAPTISGPFSVRLAATVSYNVYGNTSLFVGVDHTKTPIGGLTVRF